AAARAGVEQRLHGRHVGLTGAHLIAGPREIGPQLVELRTLLGREPAALGVEPIPEHAKPGRDARPLFAETLQGEYAPHFVYLTPGPAHEKSRRSGNPWKRTARYRRLGSRQLIGLVPHR